MQAIKILAIVLILLGLLSIMMSMLNNNSYQCPSSMPKVIYKYIPRSFEDDQFESMNVSDIFRTMFEKPDVWMLGIDALDVNKNEAVNKYFTNNNNTSLEGSPNLSEAQNLSENS